MTHCFRAVLAALLVVGLVPSARAVAQEQEKPPLAFPKHRTTLVAQLGHTNSLVSVAFSPDGKQVLTGSYDMTARLWDVASGKEIRAFSHGDLVLSVAFSADGKQVLTGGGIAKLWDVANGKEIRTFKGHYVTSVAFSPDGKQVLTGGGDATARLWDAASGKEIRAFKGHRYTVQSVAFSPDGKRVLAGDDGGIKVRLWDVVSGKEICAFEGQHSVAFSPDGKQVLTGSHYNAARLWDAASGKEIRAFEGHSTYVSSVAFSPDGKQVLTGSDDLTARLWDLASGKEIRAFQGHAFRVKSVAFSPDGKQVLTGSDDRTARLWDVASGKEIRAFQGRADVLDSVAFSQDGKQVLTGSRDETARLWDAASGKEIRALQGHGGYVSSVVFSPDGKQLLTGSDDGRARLWDGASGKEIRTFKGHGNTVRSVAFSPDGKQVLTGSYDKTARLWDAASGKEIRTFQGHRNTVYSVAFSPDGKQVLTGSYDRTARLWDAASGKEIRAFQGDKGGASYVAFSPDGKQVLTGGGTEGGTAKLWDAASGKEIRTFRGGNGGVSSVAFSPDSKQVLTGCWRDQTARLWDAASGEEIRAFRGHAVNSVAFSPNGKHVLTGSMWDQTTRLWDTATGRELCRLLSFRDGTWAVVDPAGRFDASNAGGVEGLHWVAGNEPIALSQLKERYYDPGLLAKYTGFNKAPLREVETFKDVKLFPGAEADPIAPASSKLKLNLANRGGGIGRVQVFVNGRELSADARGPKLKLDADAAKATLTIDLAEAIAKPGEKNEVRIVTWNAEGYLSSRGLTLDWEAPGKKDEQPIELHAIVVGVSDYAGDALKLRFASKDAADLAKALELGGKRLFKADKTHVTLLSDQGPAGTLPATRAHLEKAFENARKSRPTDVLVVYLAGHGIALQENGQEIYCYLTKDARTANQDAFKDPEVRRRSSITSTELTEWFKKIPALKQVLILDTCAAGAAAGKLIEHRDVSADQIRAIDRLRDRTGFHVLMGCASDRVSYEASQYSQGLLTYALLQGMRGPGLDQDLVDVNKLFRYAEEQVPQLARNIGGIQKPLVLSPKGNNFFVGRLLAEDKKLIPLTLVRPLLLRPVLQNADENILEDDLGLMARLRKRLTEESFASARGKANAAAVYVDADEMPGAIRPAGKYTVQGKTVSVRLLLRQDGQTIATLQAEGTRDELDALAERLATAILGKLKMP